MTSHHPLMKRLAGALAVGALLTASLAGCLKMEMNLALDEDRVDGSMIFAVDKEFLAFLDEFEEPGADGSAASDEFLDDLLNADLGELEGATVEEYEDDTYIGSRFRFEQVPLSEMQGTGDELSITYDPGAQTYEVTGSFDMRDMDPASADEEELGLPPGMMQQMMDSFDIIISITFPGEVRDHNGELTGTTVTWRPVVGEENPIYALASSQPAPPDELAAGGSVGGGSASTTVSLVVGLAVLVVGTAVGLGIWFLRRGRRPAGAAAGADATGTATAPPPPPGPEV